MLDSQYFKSLTSEMNSLKNRVRSFIRDNHWQTDGEWKESVLRTILRRHLPKSVEIGRGFIITDRGPSKQIDILIYDSTKPILFQDGDLIFVTPDAVLGIIEVKTSLDNSSLKTTVQNLSANIELVQRKSTGRRVFGLFSYEDRSIDITQTLKIIKDGVPGRSSRAIHCICLGKSKFIRFWHLDPSNGSSVINTWRGYNLEEQAPGYFLHNIIQEICPQSVEENKALWYPEEGKEGYRIGEIAMRVGDE